MYIHIFLYVIWPTIAASVVIVLSVVLGILLIKFASVIADRTYFDIGISSFIEKYMLRRKPKHPYEIPGLYVYTWVLRIFGIWVILVSIFGLYLVIFNP